MSDKLTKRVKQNKETAEQEIVATVQNFHSTGQEEITFMTIGAIAAINHLGSFLQAQTMRGLQKIRDEQLFQKLGFTRFDDFLNEYEHSPMSYKQFYDREKLLKDEGDDLFDVLNSLKFSARKRKLLGAGNVEIDGNSVLITRRSDDGDEFTEEIEITDRARLLQTLSALADQTVKLQTKTDKQKKQIEKQDGEIEALTNALQKGGGKSTAEAVQVDNFLRVKTALELYTKTVAELSDDEKRNAEFYLSELYAQFATLQSAYGRNDLVFGNASPAENNEFAAITSKMNDDELADLMG